MLMTDGGPLDSSTTMTLFFTNAYSHSDKLFWSQNNFLWPMMVTVQHDKMATMQVAIDRYRTLHDTKWGATMAGCSVTAVSIVIVYLFLQSSLSNLLP